MDRQNSGNCRTLAPFVDPNFMAYEALEALYAFLQRAGYEAARVSSLLGIKSLQLLEPTHFHYYDKFRLPHDDLGDLVRLFLLHIEMDGQRLRKLLGDAIFDHLARLGILVPRGSLWVCRVQLFSVDGLYLATDHRFMIDEQDQLQESPVMYIGLDSQGLVHTAPRYSSTKVLDLCTGSGVQALVASRYASESIGVDLNPRAIRFARFNAQLNGIRNVRFVAGDLYGAVAGESFDIILANPPFVPSPEESLAFRDGGVHGENILSRIVQGAADHLTPAGRLHIVTDLVNIDSYQEKLEAWWRGGAAHMLVLQTADRDDMQFSVPHSHAPFGQSYQEYNKEVERWVSNFHSAGIEAVNFGYVLIHRVADGEPSSYYRRTIHNPNEPIHEQVNRYFEQRRLLALPDKDDLYVSMHEDVRFRVEYGLRSPNREVKIHCPGNPYYTTYVITEGMGRILKAIALGNFRWGRLRNMHNTNHWLLDLTYKGILQVSRDARSDVPKPDRRRFPRDSAEASSVVREMETETTPTCLSSYL